MRRAASVRGFRWQALYSSLSLIHRVQGLEPGVYRHEPEHGLPGQPNLEKIRSRDQRVSAAGLSLRQEMAGNACVTFSLAGDFLNAIQTYGDRGYSYLHLEAGALGPALYLEAEALGLGATGIGAFFDDEGSGYLSLNVAEKHVVYHFAIGHPVPDPRLGLRQTL